MNNKQPVKIELVSGSENLYIIFGGIAAGIGMPPFKFYKASNILSKTRIFIRDLSQNWYQTGLPGISKNIEGTRDYIQNLVQENLPKQVTMIGNSMGGFAAILFSNLIGNSRAVAFAPQTFISPLKRLRHGDHRWWKQVALTYWRSWRNQGLWDLCELQTQDNWEVDIHVSRQHRLDYIHSKNLPILPCVRVHEYDIGGHELVRSLRDSGELAQILKATKFKCDHAVNTRSDGTNH